MNGRGWAFILRMADISRVRPAAAPKNTIYICFTTKTQPKHNPNTTKTIKYKNKFTNTQNTNTNTAAAPKNTIYICFTT